MKHSASNSSRKISRNTLSKHDAFILRTLLSYAKENKSFKNTLLEMTKHLESNGNTPPVFPVKESPLLNPQTPTDALIMADYLLKTSPEAKTMLAQWHKDEERTDPKNFILGLVAGTLPLGFIGDPEKKKIVSVLIRKDFYTAQKDTYTEHVIKATSSIATEAIMRAGYDLGNMEPMVADWLLGEKKVVLFECTKAQMQAVQKELKNLKTIHTATFDERGLAVMAVSPIVHHANLELEFDLRPIEDN